MQETWTREPVTWFNAFEMGQALDSSSVRVNRYLCELGLTEYRRGQYHPTAAAEGLCRRRDDTGLDVREWHASVLSKLRQLHRI